MLTDSIKLGLSLAALPYLALAGYDFILHGHHRQVPAKEKILHGILFLCLPTFIVSAILGFQYLPIGALCLAIPALILDEAVFHRNLDKHEKIIHLIAGIALLGFIATWILTRGG